MYPEANHLLHMQITAEGYITWGVSCLPEVCPGESWAEKVGGWPDDTWCRCDPPCESCADGDHGGCTNFGGYSDAVGYECRAEVDATECWVVSWVDDCGGELIHGNDWPRDPQFPLLVNVTSNGGYPEIRYAGD